MNGLLSKKINELVTTLKGSNINENVALARIKELFPSEEFKHEFIENSTDFYIEDKETIRLSSNNETKIVISYPEGDRLGNSLANSDTDIWIEYLDNDRIEKIPLFEYKQVDEQGLNMINEKMEDLLKENKPTKKYVLSYIKEYLDKYPPKLPNDLLERTDDTILLDEDVRTAVINAMKEIAEYDAGEAYDQYMYGSNGGMDVENWEMQTCEQFRLTHLPKNVERLYKNEIKDTYLLYPEAEKNLRELFAEYSVELDNADMLKNNKELIASYFNDMYKITKSQEIFISKYNDYFQNSHVQNEKIDYKRLNFDREDFREYLKSYCILKPVNLEDIDTDIAHYKFLLNHNKDVIKLSENNISPKDLAYKSNDEINNTLNELDKQINVSKTKLKDLLNQETHFFQFIKKYKLENEKLDVMNDIAHKKNIRTYLNSLLENEDAKLKINSLKSLKELGEIYNEQVSQLDIVYDEIDKNNIIQTLSFFEELPFKLMKTPSSIQSILDNKLDEIKEINKRYHEIHRDIERCEEIKKQAMYEVLEKVINEDENNQYEEQEDEYELEI